MATHNTEFFPGAASLFLLFSMGYADGNSPTLTQEKIRRGKSVAFLTPLTSSLSLSLLCIRELPWSGPGVLADVMKEELLALIRKEICCQWAIPRVLSRRTVQRDWLLPRRCLSRCAGRVLPRSVWHALSFPCLPRHPFHGAPNWNPSGIPVAMVLRPWCCGQYRPSFFGRRVGTPPLSADGHSGHTTPPQPHSRQ